MKFKICKTCVMDTSAKEIKFYGDSCNFCLGHKKRIIEEYPKQEKKEFYFRKLINNIKKNGKGKKYDCLIGLSGGVDSSYVAYILKKEGLNCLAVHLDNGWNTRESNQNIEKIREATGFDLTTKILPWKKFRDLQRAFIKSRVINIEAPTDHAITSLLYKTAQKYGIKYIISGSNLATEGLMPESWGYDNKDWRSIKSIGKKFSGKSPGFLPHMNLIDWLLSVLFFRIKFISILNYINFDKKNAVNLMVNEFGYQPYKDKHGESLFTKIYQNYILLKRFNFDKRKAHLSSQIVSGSISRDEALEILNNNDPKTSCNNNEIEYFCSKLNLSLQEFNNYLKSEEVSHLSYGNNSDLFKKYSNVINKIKNNSKDIN